MKHKADGTVERYQARLVARGLIQTYGVDYAETFSPATQFNSYSLVSCSESVMGYSEMLKMCAGLGRDSLDDLLGMLLRGRIWYVACGTRKPAIYGEASSRFLGANISVHGLTNEVWQCAV